jgi:hypothetical protein
MYPGEMLVPLNQIRADARAAIAYPLTLIPLGLHSFDRALIWTTMFSNIPTHP